MTSSLALEVRRGKTLEDAWSAIRANARISKSADTRKEIEAFEADLSRNLRRISQQLRRNKFTFVPAKGIKIPKKDKKQFRPLVVAPVQSRIVQRAIHDVLSEVPALLPLIYTPYSFGGVKKRQKKELAAVPAAIQAVLHAIEAGGTFIIRSDISSFFTRIPKSKVTQLVADAVDDKEFVALFETAIEVELENMAQLRGSADYFPIEDIGLAQGNCLSPLLGNLFLHDFDREINEQPGVRCMRYIDDFIVIGETSEHAERAFSVARRRLRALGMELSAGKTDKGRVRDGFEFLGIDLAPGLIRPCKASRERLIESIEGAFNESSKGLLKARKGMRILRSQSLLETLCRVRGIIQGWGKHYRFCNDSGTLRQLDNKIEALIKQYLGMYGEARKAVDDNTKWHLLGIESLDQIERTPFSWPKMQSKPPGDSALA
ncbi:MAG TPA: reverse transcriptase domain-containing protein [Bryobacteraceae bacterium]|nr:reverse transcriptase domain-containing protein [Bryobacteraceae bacterium]